MQNILLNVMEFGRFTKVAQRPDGPREPASPGECRLLPLCTTPLGRSAPGGPRSASH